MNSTGLCYHCDNSIYEGEEAVVLPTGERMHKDCAAYKKAMEEHRKNPVTYTHEEVGRMLDDE